MAFKWKHLIVGVLGAGMVYFISGYLTPYLGVAGAYAGFVAGALLITVASWAAENFSK